MNVKEMRGLTPEQIDKELLDLRREQFNLRMQSASGQGVRSHEFGRIRKDIARLKTVRRELEIQQKGEAS